MIILRIFLIVRWKGIVACSMLPCLNSCLHSEQILYEWTKYCTKNVSVPYLGLKYGNKKFQYCPACGMSTKLNGDFIPFLYTQRSLLLLI